MSTTVTTGAHSPGIVWLLPPSSGLPDGLVEPIPTGQLLEALGPPNRFDGFVEPKPKGQLLEILGPLDRFGWRMEVAIVRRMPRGAA